MSLKENNIFFEAASREEWTKLAEATLKGRSVDSLSHINEDGIEIDALYTSETCDPAMSDDLSVGAAKKWVVAQYIEPSDNPQMLNAMILEELKGGVEQVIFSSGQPLATVSKSMNGVLADAVVISFEHPHEASEALEQVLQIWSDQKTEPELSRASLGAEVTPDTSEKLVQFTLDKSDVLSQYPNLRVMKISGADAHRQGASAAQEIAYILAYLTLLMRDADSAGLSRAMLSERLDFDLAMEADLYGGIAKARAARLLIDRLLNAMSCPVSNLSQRLHGITSDRMLSLLDAETNMLRSGTAMLSMALSGLGIITNRPHDWLSGSSALSRRIARNVHHLLMDEAHLDQVADPSQGSYFIETLTKEIADKSWNIFQEIERQGGLKSSAAQGYLRSCFEEAHAKRSNLANEGDTALLGVSIHPVQGVQNIPDVLDDQVKGEMIKRGGQYRPSAPWEELVQAFQKLKSKCLLIDLGENHSARTTKRWFDIFGFETAAMSAESFEAGLKLIETAQPDLVIMGKEMTGAEGKKEDLKTIVKSSDDFSGNIIAEMKSILKMMNKEGVS